MDVKDELIQGCRLQLLTATNLTEAQISKVESILRIVLSSYDISHQERGLVTYDFTDVEWMQKFALAKAVEGLSKRSLSTYSSIYKKFFKEQYINYMERSLCV